MKTQIGILKYISFFGITFFLAGIIACGGGDSSEDLIQKITPRDKIYTLEDLKTAGFKKSRNYKVEGLVGATEAYWGLHDRIEIEVRFYETHEDAKTLGIPMAEESTGPDAKLKKEDATWDVGIKDRRMCGGGEKGTKDNWSHDIGSCTSHKYGEFVVYGNFIVLCQGFEEKTALSRCNDLLSKLD